MSRGGGEGGGVQWCAGVPFNAKCLNLRKLFLTESSEDIWKLTSIFEHMTTNTVTVYSCMAVSEKSILFWKFRRANNTFETQTKSPFFKQNPVYFHSPYIYLTFSFEALRSHERRLLLLLLLLFYYIMLSSFFPSQLDYAKLSHKVVT